METLDVCTPPVRDGWHLLAGRELVPKVNGRPLVETVKWTAIAGAPTHYARDLDPPLRTEGRARAFRSTPTFKAILDTAFREIWETSGLGPADVVVSAGALVNKPGMHGKGEAFDLDGIVWHATDERPEVQFFAIDFPKDPKLYCGIGSILNRHFVHCLHYLYNTPHEDHFHIDTTASAKFSQGSRSRVSFLQATLHFVHGLSIVLDGKWGQRTQNATAVAMARMGMGGSITTPNVWREYLLGTAEMAFSTGLRLTRTDDPDRAGQLPDPPEIDVEDDHEKAPDEQFRTPRFFVTRPLMRGELIRSIQEAVRDAGHDPGPIDGIYGSRTRAGVMAFQRAAGIEVDGITGPKTLAALGLNSRNPVPA